MADQPVATTLCARCDDRPRGPGLVLCTVCRDLLEARTAREIYAAVPGSR
jgi:hypothetical protein